MKWLCIVVLRDSPPLSMRFEQRVDALEASKRIAEGETELIEVGPDADNSQAWVDPSRVQALLVTPDAASGQIAVPQLRAQRR